MQVLSGLNQLDLNYVLVHINTAALFEVAEAAHNGDADVTTAQAP